MSPIFISIIVVLVAVFATAAWMDFRRRRLDDTNSAGVMGQARRQVRLEGKEKGQRWGSGG